MDLGAGPVRAFVDTTLPIIAPGARLELAAVLHAVAR